MLERPKTPRSGDDSTLVERKLILSVDDEMGVLRSRQVMLEAAGYDVLNASSGEQALGVFSTIKVDLVVLDYSMPGVNGGEVAKVMKARRPELPVLIVSGRPVEREIFSRVDGFLVKGDTPALLLQRIEQLLNPVPQSQSSEEPDVTGNGENKRELWEELALLASTEKDPDKLLALAGEINRLLEKKEEHLKHGAAMPAHPEIDRLMDRHKSLPDDGSNKANSQ